MKITQFIPTLLALLAIGFRYFSNWCIDFLLVCYGTFVHQIALSFTKPIYFFSLSFVPVAIVLAFVPKIIFQSWLRLARWFVPLSLVIIFITPVTSNSWMPIFFVSREEVSWYLGVFFSIISLALIIWKWWKSRDSGQV